MSLKIFILCVFSATSFFLTTTDAASQPIGLDRCIEFGNTNNPVIKTSQLDQILNKPAKLAAIGQFLPRVSASYGINQSSSRISTFVAEDGRVVELPALVYGEMIPVENRKNRNSRYSINVSETVFNGGRNYYNFKNAGLQEKIREYNYSGETFLLRSAITTAYCSALAATERLSLAEELLTQRRRQHNLARVRFETGSVTRRDVMQAEVDLGRAENDSLSAVMSNRQTLENLNFLIGFPIDSSYTLSNLPDLFNPDWDSEKLAAEALTHRSDYVISDLSIKMNRNNHTVSKGRYLPQVAASLSHSRSEQSGANVDFTLDPRNRSTAYNLSLSWELFDGFTRELNLEQSRIQHRKSIINRQDLERQIFKQVSEILYQLRSFYQQSLVADQNVGLANETLRFEEERYKLGSATTIELGVAQVSYIQARNDLINIENNFYIALGELENATGMVLRRQ